MTTRTDLPPLSAETAGVDLWADVVGQDDAIAELRAAVDAPVHAYLLVGPRGWGARELARAFAAGLVSHSRSLRTGQFLTGICQSVRGDKVS